MEGFHAKGAAKRFPTPRSSRALASQIKVCDILPSKQEHSIHDLSPKYSQPVNLKSRFVLSRQSQMTTALLKSRFVPKMRFGTGAEGLLSFPGKCHCNAQVGSATKISNKLEEFVSFFRKANRAELHCATCKIPYFQPHIGNLSNHCLHRTRFKCLRSLRTKVGQTRPRKNRQSQEESGLPFKHFCAYGWERLQRQEVALLTTTFGCTLGRDHCSAIEILGKTFQILASDVYQHGLKPRKTQHKMDSRGSWRCPLFVRRKKPICVAAIQAVRAHSNVSRRLIAQLGRRGAAARHPVTGAKQPPPRA